MGKKGTRFLLIFVVIYLFATIIAAQPPNERPEKQKVRTMTIPITIFTKTEIKKARIEEYVEARELTVTEDNDQQEILSIRSVSDTNISIAFLIQDDLGSNVNLQLKDIADFIRSMPEGSRVLIGYIRGGTVQIKQKFTDDREKAIRSLRIASPILSSSNGPYDGVADLVKRFDALPTGRRAIVLVTDGLTTGPGASDIASISNPPELERAINRAQQRSVAVYSIFTTSPLSESVGTSAVVAAQSALIKLSDETGGKAFMSGTLAPVSFEPFLKDLGRSIMRQFAITYLSTHMKKGYHKVTVKSSNPEVKIGHPAGYYYR